MKIHGEVLVNDLLKRSQNYVYKIKIIGDELNFCFIYLIFKKTR